jgi:hypothetical protein
MSNELTIRDRLMSAGRVLRLAAVAAGTLWWLVVAFGAWLALFLLDNLVHLPAGLRLPLSLTGFALLAVGFARQVLRPALRRPSPERTAVLLEKQGDVRDNHLINACQFDVQPLRPAERALARRSALDSAQTLSAISPAALWKTPSLAKWGIGAAAVLAIWLVYVAAFPRQSWNALARYAMPLTDIPPVGSLAIALDPPSDISINEGSDLTVHAILTAARTADPDADPAAMSAAIVWAEGADALPAVRTAGESAPMTAEERPGAYAYVFRAIQRSFRFRVFAADSYSRSVCVRVVPLPRVKTSTFRIVPPPYTGQAPQERPGPPAPVTCLPGSVLEMQIRVEPAVASLAWVQGQTRLPLAASKGTWAAGAPVNGIGAYELTAVVPDSQRTVVVAAGDVRLETDRPPDIDFLTQDRNRFVEPGTELQLDVQAADDFGLWGIQVVARRPEADPSAKDVTVLRQWRYLGPPGHPGPLKETFRQRLDPAVFCPGETYVLEAQAWDFMPDRKPSVSRPVVLRIKALNDVGVSAQDPLAKAVNLLKAAIADQRKANEFTDNLRTHREEALVGKTVPRHRDAMAGQQGKAKAATEAARAEFAAQPADGGTEIAGRLNRLARNEMDWTLAGIGRLPDNGPDADLAARADAIAERQGFILNELIGLLGRIAEERKDMAKGKKPELAARKDAETPVVASRSDVADLRDSLKDFMRDQKRIVDMTKALMDKRPEDLTIGEEEVLGALAREEAKWAALFEEKLTDFGKLPIQDFADSSVAQELNEVFQDVDKAAASLYAKNIEMAVPQEQSGLESAEELVHNLERWLLDIPDNLKWSMEEPPAPADIPMAELPAELEDIVGDLLDQEEAMGDDVEDISSSWLDSLDKGAGWMAMDGPISDMSAKGITGNLLPNQMEIGGRSGEGRTGRSSGQMVEDSAEGKGGRKTPSRLTPSPFESGSIQDSSTGDSGAATGGGKLSGFTLPGLRGPQAPPSPAKLQRLAGRQTQIRQQAETLALKLRRYKLPSGDLEDAIAAMKRVEESAQAADGLGVRRAYNRAVDALEDSRKAVRAETGLHTEHSRIPKATWNEVMSGFGDGVPRGYEEMVTEYFRQMAMGEDEKK